MNYLVSYVNDQGNEQKEMFESAQMVSGFIEQLLHTNQARPEDIKIFKMEQLGFHVETIPVVKIDDGVEVAFDPDAEAAMESEMEAPYEDAAAEMSGDMGPELVAGEENPS